MAELLLAVLTLAVVLLALAVGRLWQRHEPPPCTPRPPRVNAYGELEEP